jgi:type IV fimbrial biogenesis protein FimT
MHFNKLKSTSGITMIEILMTLVIVGILASLATPRFESAMANIKFRSANRDLQSSLRYARSMALTNKKQYGVFVDPDTRTITIFQDSLNPADYTYDSPGDLVLRVDTLPSEISSVTTDFDNGVITFAPNGTAGFSGGGTGGANIDTEGSISGNRMAYNVEVKRATGRVKMAAVDEEADREN